MIAKNIIMFFITIKKIYFDNTIISYDKFYELVSHYVIEFGKSYNDKSLYRLTQCFDAENNPSEYFYYSNYSLGKNTSFKSVRALEFTKSFGLVFLKRENNHGIFNKTTKTKVWKYWGKSRQVVNGPYILKINFGDYLSLSNDLLLIIPKQNMKQYFSLK